MRKISPFILLLFTTSLFGADTGFKFPTANDAAGWTSPENAHASDDVWSTADLADTERYKTFAFGLTTETIDGFTVQMECQQSDFPGQAITYTVNLSWDGGTTWTTESNTILCDNAFGADETVTVGGATSLFGRSWTASELSDANFKIRFVEPSICPCMPGSNLVDAVAVKVNYTAAASGTVNPRRKIVVTNK